MKPIKFRKKVLFRNFCLAVLPMLLGYMLFSAYGAVKRKTIDEFNTLQMILARQAATGIEDHFKRFFRDLDVLKDFDSLVLLTDQGKALMKTYYLSNKELIRAFTRIDAAGKIIHTEPYDEKFIGSDLSYQDHVREVARTKQPVVSEVFAAIQGYKAVACAVPIIRDGRFYGSFSILLPFDDLVKRYIENIRIGKSGYAWVISKTGVEIYCPIPGHTGKPVFETCKEFPAIISMAREMMKGDVGVTTYSFDRARDDEIDLITKHAVFYPIRLKNTFWSIIVATPEEEVLATMTGFQKRFFFIGALLILVGLIYSYYFIRTRAILGEARKRIKAETALQEGEARLRQVIDLVPHYISAKDSSGRFILANKAVAEAYGTNTSDIIGKTSADFNLHEDEVQPLLQQDQWVIKTGQPQFFPDNKITDVFGNVHITEIVKIPFSPFLSETDAVLSVMTDITERKGLEAKLRHAQRMEAIGTLAGGIAHDFNNILMGIQGRTSLMMMDTETTDPRFDHMEGIESLVKSAAELTRQLLGFARGGKYEVKPTRLNDLIDRITRMFGRTKKEILIHSKYPDDLWTVEVDRGQIEQVWMNLLVNAWQAMPGGGDMFSETQNVIMDEALAKTHGIVPGRYVKISLTDTGTGMEKEVQEKIFDPFFTTKEKGRGTGLGLASAYGIIKNHNGIINVYSEKGKGSTFTIYLPASSKEVREDDGKNGNVLKGTETILLVDDEDIVLEVNEQILKTLGYEILTAKNGVQATEVFKLNSKRISLVILDMVMPDMDGGEVFDRIREIEPGVKVLLCSGYSINGKAAEIMKRGCDGFVQKPFDMASLSKKLRDILDA